MDSFDIKVEKANAILRYKRLQKVTALFRLMEVFIFLFILTKIPTQLPFSFKFLGDFFRGVFTTMFSPVFIFILGNAIVVILFFKSGQVASQESESIDFCAEYVERCEKRVDTINKTEEKIKKQGKQGSIVKQGRQSKCDMEQSSPNFCNIEDQKIHRSKSVDLKRYQHENSRRELRRSATEKCRKSVNCSGVSSYAEDEMSGDEFRRTVEAFIARQQRSLREEEVSAIITVGA